MKSSAPDVNVFQHLQQEILSLQGYSSMPGGRHIHTGLDTIENAFPGQVFPAAGIHEFISAAPEHAAATSAFITGLLSAFMHSAGYCLWISTRRTLFPPALKIFGIEPERIIFIDLAREKEALWAIEEALKCNALAAVVGELSELSFTESRRLQLAVEESRVTGFIHRYRPRAGSTTASISRWKISSLPSVPETGMPGIGHPRWNVQLLRVRNGRPGAWQVEWTTAGFGLRSFLTQTVSKQAVLKTG